MFEELVTEFGLTVDDGCIKYATYEDVYVMSTMYNTMYIRKNKVLKNPPPPTAAGDLGDQRSKITQ